MKALFINGSPRKNGNTAQLLKRAMDGASEAGAEVELVNLYDRSLNYKGCMSCFACKVKGGKKGKAFAHSRMTFSPYSRRPWRPTCWCADRPTIVAIHLQPFVPLWNEWSFPQSTIPTTPNPLC